MKPISILHIIGLLAFLSLLLPAQSVSALDTTELPPADMFQLPWEQGISWVSMDGFDNGFKRGWGSPHNYLNGGAVDFAPRADMQIGEDTSNYWVTATAAGTITEKGICHLKIDHQNGWISEYQFLANIQVQIGDEVYRNQRLAIIADGERDLFCPGSDLPNSPHVHYTLRPAMEGLALSGWQINYNPLLNKTSFTKNGETVPSFMPLLNVPNLQIVSRDTINWDTVYSGSIDAYRYERWSLQLSEEMNSFTITATALTDRLTPFVLLLDSYGHELARGTGTLNTIQPAGNYFVQIQPQEGAGFYNLLAEKNTLPSGPYASVLAPSSLNIGDVGLVTVYLGNTPPEGYTSAEFMCNYSDNLEVSNIVVKELFGDNPAIAINNPQNSDFIVAIAGSSLQRATTSGAAFTFEITAISAGEAHIECPASISKGDGILTAIESISASLTVSDSPAPMSTGFSATSPASQNNPASTSALTGKVTANKPVTINLYDTNNALIASGFTNSEGLFSLFVPAGTYTAVAEANGFLKSRYLVTLIEGDTGITLDIHLLAGDIDQNNVIDQFDAMTIGMSYNTAAPNSADLNNDGIINVLDLGILAANYRAISALIP
ncbi:MAG: peptidoglycan DD-metalloendopeptidase family protein [Anaerolineae bacterium]|jgi:murein DD-endopeptidase MepM/ murein hydrolase activator NlpD|nr:peptidoglycan DD-metalloendopeptidase family protein [Anaerolineae bacterium]MBT7191237.1 peptidoglycan DD-metalloendopeptidase family protein [Anaerolineae bacterium]MBT7989002.1 peptidoglycan DD-metalloendopeptidase family protein [Anaerolineae bacterium]